MTEGKEIECESALEAIARLQDRPGLYNLERNLFPTGPECGEVIEIFGECSVGKTLLLLEFIKKCILPKVCKGRSIGGLEAEVILLNTDLHFNILTLVKLLRLYLECCFPKKNTKRDDLISEIIDTSLKKLIILNVFNSETLHSTFYLVQRILIENSKVSLILLDSVSAFYWQDRMAEGVKKMDSYVQQILNNFHNCIYPFKVTLIFTRPSYFQTKNTMASDCSSVYDLQNINTSIQLKTCLREGSSSHVAEVRTSTAFFVKFYTISDRGISWSL